MPVSNRPITITGHDLLGTGGKPQTKTPHQQPDGALLGRLPVAYGPTTRLQDTQLIEAIVVLQREISQLKLDVRPWYIKLRDAVRDWWPNG